jgi:dTDP-glucose 4,6-dehydratase
MVRDALRDGADAIVNFAAETHVDRSILEPEAFLRTDILGTHVLLEAVRKHGIGRYVQVSTDEVYGDVAEGDSLETDALRPRSPYSASKAGGDLQVLAYMTTFGTPVLITRGSNTYGPFQHPEKLIPLFVTNLIDDQQVPVYGDGLQIRDWLHAEDHARGILHVLEMGEAGNVYNIGGGNPHTNLEITERLVSGCGRSMDTHVKYVEDRAGHDRRYAVNCAKARALGWEPRIAFDRGLHDTIEWYKANESWWRPLRGPDFMDYYQRQYANR